jgi:ABC-type transport system substrate-binding protein
MEPVPKAITRQDGEWNDTGPFIDRVLFQVIAGPDVQVAALISGDIDHLADNVDAAYIDELEANPNVEVTYTERLGWGFLAVNCERYPAEFRRALAYAADKHEVASIMWASLGFPLDIPVPAAAGVWHNEAANGEYHDPNRALAEAELLAGGFVDLDGDGYVEFPNGDPLVFEPMYSISAPQWLAAMTSQSVYWDEIGIRTEPVGLSFNTLLDIVFTIPRNYDGANFAYGVGTNPLALQMFISSEIANPEGNFVNWANPAYDTEVDIMLSSSDYATVLEAAHNAQTIFSDECPMVIWYSNWVVNAHRTDRFDGWVEIPGWGTGPMNRWTARKIYLKEGQPDRDPVTGCGGTYTTIISVAMDTQNPLMSTSVYGTYPLSHVYSSLTGLNDPEHQPTTENGGLSYSWTSEEVDLGGGDEGMKFTFTMYDNATWHDMGGEYGGRVTAYDVEFSYNYILDNAMPTYSASLPYLNSCTAIDETTVEVVTNGRSYWAFDYTRGWDVIPMHIWEGIVSPTTFTNPFPIGCGPFQWYRRVEGEYVELRYWENYHSGVLGHTVAELDAPSYLGVYIIVGVVVIVVVLLGSVWYLRRK